ncbi:30S ribosomal protein S10 [Candidatus Vidania fulgoroideae]|nr:30S ribosomal protein S10 [Candidatus Vidania fulgoroideae]
MNLNIYFFSFSQFSLEKTCFNFKDFLMRNKIKHKGPVFFPTKKKIINILRSPHIDKNSRDQFFYTYYKFLIIIFDIKRTSFKQINNYNIPPSIGAKYVFDNK